jgi:hypothetical protein
MERRRGKEEKGEGIWDWEGGGDGASRKLVIKRKSRKEERIEEEGGEAQKMKKVEGW